MNRRGQRKPLIGRRVEPSFRTMINYRAWLADRLVQAPGVFLRERPPPDPGQLLEIQLTHHLHTWPRETKFQCYETYIPSSHTAVRTRRVYTFRAGNDEEEGVAWLDWFISLGFHSRPYSVFTYTYEVMSCFSFAFSFTILCMTRAQRLIYASPLFVSLSLGPKDDSRTRAVYSTTITHTSRAWRC